ncbi:MAG: Hpt domain-containing protein, partial [Gammaproteobacteria bacterium]|nr:Hpt domain-containing protein [Gammaproteobacteria bacterium]
MSGNDELFAIFRDEVTETLEQLETHLEALRAPGLVERAPEIDAAFRHAHNLKGAARIVGHDTIVTITHAMEDVLSNERHSCDGPSEVLLDVLMQGLTIIQRAVDGEEQYGPADEFLARIGEALEVAGDESSGMVAECAPTAAGERAEPGAATTSDSGPG